MLATLRRICSGERPIFGGPPRPGPLAAQIRTEQIAAIRRHMPWVLLANVGNAMILVAAFWPSPQRLPALAWAGLVLAFAAFHAGKIRRRATSAPRGVSPRAVKRATRNALLLGCIWAALPLHFFIGASAGAQLIITCLCAGMLSGGAFAFATIPAAAVAFMAPIFIASSAAILRSGDPVYFLVALLMIIYTCVLLRGVWAHALQLASRVAAQLKAEDELRRDALTGLPNRLALREWLQRTLEGPRAGDGPALFFLDINELKAVNEKLGRATGDEILVQLSDRIGMLMQEGDLLARIGGDEFALAAAGVTSAQAARGIAERILKAFDAPFVVAGSSVAITVSIGVACAPADGADTGALLRSAEVALQDAKRGLAGAVQFYDPGHERRARERRAIEQDLRGALDRQEFRLVFQPLLDLAQDRITGCEALLRWTHPSLGSISPADFIPVAEQTGLIGAIGAFVLREACRAAAAWPDSVGISVNVSAVQFRDAEILKTVVAALADAHILPHRLELEITESILISDSDFALSMLHALRDLGVRIALDDFGTGYSSLSYLRKLPLDSIKIDHSFVRDMTREKDCAAIVKSVIGLARDLGMSVTAEGVETPEQLEQLRTMGCTRVQGYLIGAPRPAAAIADLLEQPGGRVKVSQAG